MSGGLSGCGLRVACWDLKPNRRPPAHNRKIEFMKKEVRTIEYDKVLNTSYCSMLTTANRKD